ncbi:PKD domain-containing protein [Haloarcula litorea]|uniref:PKD domain-containing protein n=1 Tax=Haloarcula litorea TaxID=3032579 RepID=UPI0023E832F4|nr:PKD domain-containing protein [Halomicroarcula sp. GDY20]
MHGRYVTLVGLLALAVAAGGAAASGNSPPLADAGLDQTVSVDTTVYLDANGSRDPDGSVAGVTWTIETPGDATTTPACPTCRQTTFTPSTTGRYDVTVTVTDDDGATRSDTLYVTATAAGSRSPRVGFDGPERAVAGRSTTLTAVANASEADLETVAWVVDGAVVDRRSLSGRNATPSLTHTFESSGTVPVRVVVYDALGHRGTASRDVAVGTALNGDPASNGSGPAGGGRSSDCDYHFHGECIGDIGSDLQYQLPGEEAVVVDTNDESGIQLYVDSAGEVRTASELGVDIENFEVTDGVYDLDALGDAMDEAHEQRQESTDRTGSGNGPTSSDSSTRTASDVTTGTTSEATDDDVGGCTIMCGAYSGEDSSESEGSSYRDITGGASNTGTSNENSEGDSSTGDDADDRPWRDGETSGTGGSDGDEGGDSGSSSSGGGGCAVAWNDVCMT